MKNKLGLFFAAIILTSVLSACGDSKNYYDSYEEASASYDSFYAESDYEYSDYDNNYNDEKVSTNRKLIKTYSLDVETDDLNKMVSIIEDKTASCGGYIESLNVSTPTYGGGYANITARIPANKAEEFKKIIGENSNVTDESLGVDDVTLTYVDLESKKNAYLIEQERLLEFLESAETMEDILSIESRLSELRYEIDSMESRLRTYDNLVDYSTFNIYVSKVTVYTEPEPETFGAQIVASFRDGVDVAESFFKGLVLFVVGAAPVLVVLALIAGVVALIVVPIVKANKKRANKKAVVSTSGNNEINSGNKNHSYMVDNKANNQERNNE